MHSSSGPKYIPGTDSERAFFERFGENVIEEYKALSSKIGLMLRGTQQECEEMIVKLRAYRHKHRGLYSDVKEPGEKKTFILHDSQSE